MADAPYMMRTLDNGLRVIVIQRPGLTVASRAFIRAGSRRDGAQHGITHCVEHMLFRGTWQRDSRQIYRDIEALGGRIDAATSKDYLSVSVVTGAADWGMGLDVLADVIRQPRLSAEDWTAERRVILEEIARRADTRQMVWDLYDLTLWQVHPLRHRPLGYAAVVEGLAVDELAAHYCRCFVPAAALLVVCGACDPAAVFKQVECLWGDWSGAAPGSPLVPVEPPLADRRVATVERNSLQSHLVLGWPTVGLHHPDSYVLKVIDRLLGIGGNSRLYQELRERLGLAYAVATVRAEHEDTGHFAVYTAVDPTRQQAAIDAILAQVDRLQQQAVPAAELRAAQAAYAGSLALAFETNLNMAGIVGIESLLMGCFESFAEASRRVRAVTQEDVQRVAQQYLNTERYALATMGPRC